MKNLEVDLSTDDIQEVYTLKNCYLSIHSLLNASFPKEPRDVFYRFSESYKEGYPSWILVDEGLIKGMCFVIPNSKGGTLECVAIHPELWGHGAGRAIVERVIADYGGLITLTTRIPEFYEKIGFKLFCDLKDGTKAMYIQCG